MEQNAREDFYEDDAPPSLLIQKSRGGWDRKEKFYLVGAGVLVLIIVILALWPGGEKETVPSTADSSGGIASGIRFDVLDQRMVEIENRLNRLASPGGTGDSGPHAARSLANAERIEQILARLDTIDRRLDEMRKSAEIPAVVPAAAAPVSRTTPKSGTQASAAQYHTVAKGDTPYSIARKYGIALHALLQLNGMDSKSVIRPGDRVRIR